MWLQRYDGGMLTGTEIQKQVEKGNITIKPFDPKRVNPNSYNLRLSNKLVVYKSYKEGFEEFTDSKTGEVIDFEKCEILDVHKKPETIEIEIPEEGFVLKPNVLYLASTMEYTSTDIFIPMLEGRSSIGRYGIDVHKTAGFGDVGFKGTWTLEIVATEEVRIYPGMEICQISYHTPVGELDKLYNGKYLGQEDPVASRLYTETEVTGNDNIIGDKNEI
jgi:dCTP deaminase